jgi:N-acyl-D-aspartate/D-glutamate deacylase
MLRCYADYHGAAASIWCFAARPSTTALAHLGSSWHNVLITSVASPDRRAAQGRRVSEIAAAECKDALEYVLDLLIADRGATVMVVFLMAAEDVRTALSAPFAAIGSDLLGVTSASARVHPRAYGTFVRRAPSTC